MSILFLFPLMLSLFILIFSSRVTEEVELMGIRLVAILSLAVSLIFTPMWFKGMLLIWLFLSERSSVLTSSKKF